MTALYVRTISRGQGHSAIRAAAYCGRRRLYDERQKKHFNFSKRPGLLYSELRLPKDAPPRLHTSEALWNAIEHHLTRINARLGRELILALPRGWPLSLHVPLMRGFLEDEFVSRGHAVDWHIHGDKPRNPHAHVLVSFPTLNEQGFGPADKNWDRRAWLVGLHGVWHRHCEHHGALAAHRPSVSYGSLHLGSAHALATRGLITRQTQRLAALHALSTVRRAKMWPGWLRLRLRRKERHDRSRRRALHEFDRGR